MASATQRSVEDIDWNLDWNSQLNIVYVNIDWKSTRHNTQESCARNKRTLQETIASIVAQMRPDILCMSEVGVASSLMTEEQLEAVAEWCVEQWKRTATGRAGAGFRSPEYQSEQAWKAAQENFSLSVLYAKDAPYMTIYTITRNARASRTQHCTTSTSPNVKSPEPPNICSSKHTGILHRVHQVCSPSGYLRWWK